MSNTLLPVQINSCIVLKISEMPFKSEDIQNAMRALTTFRQYAVSPHHERYSFPFLCGSYFTYRKVDVARVVLIAKAISSNPRYLDVGCGYGDFLEKIREYLPDARGIEKNAEIFYACNKPKPDFIDISDAEWDIDDTYDITFVGWMEPGVDFRDKVASKTDVVITTIDQGLSLGAEYDGHGFRRIAAWRTPSWDDVNTEIMNRYYTSISGETRRNLSKLRTAHNLWYIYSKPSRFSIVRCALMECIKQEDYNFPREHYDFESVLDDCGFGYHEELDEPTSEIGASDSLWEIRLTRTP
jgi:SAM-dependent methyltransferase